MTTRSSSSLTKERSLPSFWEWRVTTGAKAERPTLRRRHPGAAPEGSRGSLRPYLLPGLIALGAHLALFIPSGGKTVSVPSKDETAKTILSLVAPGSREAGGNAAERRSLSDPGESQASLFAAAPAADFRPASGPAYSTLPVSTDALGGLGDTEAGAAEAAGALAERSAFGSSGFGADRVSGGAALAGSGLRPLLAPLPFYPEKARLENRKGVVELQLRLDGDGRPLSAVVVASSGHADLDETARQTVFKSWRFPKPEPGKSERSTRVVVRFDLSQPDASRITRR